MEITGNWMIDGDTGTDPRSPYYEGDESDYCEICGEMLEGDECAYCQNEDEDDES